jgi:adenine deaminase
MWRLCYNADRETKMEKTIENLKLLIRAGQAKIPADLAIRGGTLVNVMTGETYPADVAVYRDTIVAVGDITGYIGDKTEILDASGSFLTPGLIDGHIHVECSKLSVSGYASVVVPHGTTAMISGLDEYISVSGIEGLKEIFAEFATTPLKVFWGAPYKTPYTFPPSTITLNFTKEIHAQVQKWDQCFGVWELVREAVLEEDEDTLGALAEAAKNRLPVFGCAPMARGKDLNGYLCSGVRLDHESYDHEEVLEKMRKGMHMLIRESSVTHFLKENIRAVTEVNPALARRVSFCTDDVSATDIITKGHLDNVVRLAISCGVPPVTAIQMATINSAEAYRIDHLIGSISPGRIADILLVDAPETFNVKAVVVNGKLTAKDSKLVTPLKAPARSPVLAGRLKCAKTVKEDFLYKVKIRQGTAKVLSMETKGPFVRKRRDVTLKVEDFAIIPDPAQDVAMVSVIERFGKNGNKSLAFCSGWNLKKGAMASSAAPDDNNLIVMGVNPADMSLAANHLINEGGGQVVVADGKILEFLPLPVGGIVSDDDPVRIMEAEHRLTMAARELGCQLPEPLMYMFFLPITAIRDYAITDVGPVDCVNLNIFDPLLETSGE